MNVGGIDYIPYYTPLYTTPDPSNSFLMTHPPQYLHGTSGWGVSSNYVVPFSTSVIVSGGYVSPYVSEINILVNPIIMVMQHLLLKVYLIIIFMCIFSWVTQKGVII